MNKVLIRFGNPWWQRVLGLGSRAERIGLAMSLAMASAALGWVAWERHALTLQLSQAQSAVERAKASAVSVTRPAARTAGPSTPADTLRQMDAAVGRLNVPWSAVLDAIERSTTQAVALLALEPDARTGSVGLTVEARTLDELLLYAQALGQDPAVASVRMGQHDQRTQEPGQPVRMTLSISPTPLRP